MAQAEHTLRKNEKELERQFEGVLEVCNNIASSMKSIIQLLYKTFTESLTNLSRGEEYDFTKLNYEVSEMLESFLVSKDITPVYNLSTTIKTSMSKIIMLLEDVENLQYESLTPLYDKCMKLFKMRVEELEEKKLEVRDFGSDKGPQENPLTINLNNIDTNGGGGSSYSGNFSSAKKFDDLDSFKRKSVTTNSEYQGSYEDNRPYKLNRSMFHLAKVVKNHDLSNYAFSIKRDLGLAKGLSDGFYDLANSLKFMVEKIHNNVPLNCLEKMHNGVSQLEKILKETSEVEVKIMDEKVVSGLEEISEAELHHEVSFEGCEFKSFDKKEKNMQDGKVGKTVENDFVSSRMKSLIIERMKKMENKIYTEAIERRVAELGSGLQSKFDKYEKLQKIKNEGFEKLKGIFLKLKMNFDELVSIEKYEKNIEKFIGRIDGNDEELRSMLKKIELEGILDQYTTKKIGNFVESEEYMLRETVKEMVERVSELLSSLKTTESQEKSKQKNLMKQIKMRHIKQKRSLDLSSLSKKIDSQDDQGRLKKLLFNLIKSTSVMCCSLAAICSCKRDEKLMTKVKENISR